MKILVTDGIAKDASIALKKHGHQITEEYFTPEQLKNNIKDYDAIIVRSRTKVTKDIIDASLETKKLKLIIRAGVGIDNIDVTYARCNGIEVKNTPGASSLSVAELTIGQIFTLARNLHRTNVSMRNGKWEKKKFTGIELAGKILGLIGFGRIAKETARLANALGMRVIYYTRSGKKQGFGAYEFASMDVLLQRADFISLHVPYDKDKGPLIGSKQFDLMKDGVYLINCARGGVVSEEALLDALDSGKVAGAAVDVYEHEPTQNKRLYTHEKISLTPHIGASTIEAQNKVGHEVVKIVQSHFYHVYHETPHQCVQL